MRFKITFIIVVCSLATAYSQQSFSRTEVQEDLQYLYKKLAKIHPGLYAYQDSLDWHRDYENRIKNLEKSYTAPQAFLAISPVVNNIKDLHTGIYPSKKWFKNNKKQIPLYLSKRGDKYYVAFSAAVDTNIVRGTEITHIAHQNVDSLFRVITTLYAPDNANESSKNYYASVAFFRYLRYIQALPDSLEMGFISPQDSVFNSWIKPVEVKEVNKKIIARYPDAALKNLAYEIIDSTQKVAKLTISSFKMKGKPWQLNEAKFKKTLARRMEAIAKDSIRYLALDMRGNGGGAIVNVPRVLRYFLSEPFAISHKWSIRKSAFMNAFPVYNPLLPVVGLLYFKEREGEWRYRSSEHMKVYSPHAVNHYDGELYIFGNGGSYSATVFTSSILVDRGRAKYIGNRAGGTKWGSYAGRWYNGKLPNTKIRFRIPYYKIEHELLNPSSEVFIEPEYEIYSTFDQFIERKDAYDTFFFDLVTP